MKKTKVRKIKVTFKEFNEKTTEELLVILKEIKLRLMTGVSKYGVYKEKGFDPKQDRKNIARIKSILGSRGK